MVVVVVVVVVMVVVVEFTVTALTLYQYLTVRAEGLLNTAPSA